MLVSLPRPGRSAHGLSPERIRRTLSRGTAYSVLALYALISLYPFIWMIGGAFRRSNDVLNAISPIPTHPSVSAFSNIWRQLGFDTYMVNSIRVFAVAALVCVSVFPLAAYALAMLKFRLSGFIYRMFIAIMFVPGISLLLPLILLEHSLGLLDTRVGLSLAYVNGGGPLGMLLLVNYFRSLPAELRQAAQLDGASEWTIFRRIYLPLAKPAIAALLVILSIGWWNEFLFASVSLTTPARFTLPLGLEGLLSTNVIHWNNVMAGSTVVVIPTVVVFLLCQKYFFNGLRGALRG